MNPRDLKDFVDATWESSILPALEDYIRIPALSPMFDPKWEETGHLDRAVDLIGGWCRDRGIEGLRQEVVRLPGRTPLLYMEVPGEGTETVVLYGHLDKQPPMTGWDPDLGPWSPVRRNGRLYGRGGADDGYAAFASLTAIEALRRQGVSHARCVILIEASEESGSSDLPAYIEHLADRIGTPSLIVCLDSGSGNYEQLWCTTSLRGILVGNLHVEMLREGVHSGSASGIVPSTFRIARMLLDRLEDPATGESRVPEFQAGIPADRLAQVKAMVEALGSEADGGYPLLPGARTVTDDLVELVLNNTWRPTLSVTGAEGLPPLETAGNVLRPRTSLKLSLRLPPTVEAEEAGERLRRILEADPPYGAKVRFELEGPGTGWNAPALAPWLEKSLRAASLETFGGEACFMGEGGSIPFMALLGERYPKTQFLITGLLGPESNAHGPNEFLHIAAGKHLTSSVALVLADHHRAHA